jgi:DNA primase
VFSEKTIEEIRSRVDLVELIGEYVELKKSGTSYKGLCPFHGEKTPSFHVQPLKQIFHCFGCHKGGNCFTFLIGVEGLNFPEAVKKLAARVGVVIEEETKFVSRNPRDIAPSPRDERIYEALEWAAKYFNYLLLEISENEFAREYCKNRGLSLKTLQKFRMGVSPKGWNTLMNIMFKKGFTFDELVEAGLVIPKEGKPNEGYDRFRNRLMFPINHRDGKVVGFGARLLSDEPDQPKYLNSPESTLFSKRKILYGLHENQRNIRLRGEAVVVEGYMDVVGLSEKGVNNAIATMGTALTEEHCAELKGLTQKVVTVFDPDSAGNDAWHRSVHIFMGSRIFARDLSLPNDLDPDEFVQQEGAETFYELCKTAPRQITKYLKEIATQGNLSEEESAKQLNQLIPILAASRNLPDRATLWDDICLVFKVSREALKELAESGIKSRSPQIQPVTQRPKTPTRAPIKNEAKLSTFETEFFKACLRWPERFLETQIQDWESAVKHPEIKRWLKELAKTKSIPEFEKLLESLINSHPSSPLLALATEELFEENKQAEGSKVFAAILNRARRLVDEEQIKSLTVQIKLAQRMGDETEVLKLLEKLKELRTS